MLSCISGHYILFAMSGVGFLGLCFCFGIFLKYPVLDLSLVSLAIIYYFIYLVMGV